MELKKDITKTINEGYKIKPSTEWSNFWSVCKRTF